MAAENGSSGGGTRILLWVLGALGLALGGLGYALHVRAAGAFADLRTAIDRHGEMQDLKRTIESFQRRRLPVPKDAGGDPLAFLSTKARQAQIPTNLFNVARNANVSTGGWDETPFVITLRAAKETPLTRDCIVDFLRLVEDERPTLRSKNLNLSFAENDLSSATLTLSSFQRKEAAPPKNP